MSGREIGLRGKGGEEVPVEVHLRIVPQGGDWIYIETAIDISGRKALEARMSVLRAEWDSFIRHELRNPLTLRVRVVDRPEEACVSGHNRGTPIPEGRLKTIFEKFNTTKRDQKGIGLGTTIAKLFVEAHGGRMEVASSETEGTVFTVSILKAAPLVGDEGR